MFVLPISFNPRPQPANGPDQERSSVKSRGIAQMRSSSARALPTLSALSTRQGDSVTASSRQCVLFVRSCCVDRFFTGPTIIPDMPSSPSRSGRIRNIPILAIAQYNAFFSFFKPRLRKKRFFFELCPGPTGSHRESGWIPATFSAGISRSCFAPPTASE